MPLKQTPYPQRVRYPKMERQDLTQSQLGSFKFVPTDPIDPTNQFQELEIPHWSVTNAELHEQQMASMSMHLAHRGGHYGTNATTASSLSNLRLQQGPAAIRAAIDSSRVSPSRKSPYMQDNLQPLAPPFVPRGVCDSGVVAATLKLPLTHVVAENRPEDFVLQQTSLIRALTAEQDAHALTKADLSKERERREAKDIEVRHLTDHNRSLVGTVNMLKSLVQHNMKREEERENSTRGSQTSDVGFARPADQFRMPIDRSPRLHEILEDPKCYPGEILYKTASYGAIPDASTENCGTRDDQSTVNANKCKNGGSKLQSDVYMPDTYELIDLSSEKGEVDIAYGSIASIVDSEATPSEPAVIILPPPQLQTKPAIDDNYASDVKETRANASDALMTIRNPIDSAAHTDQDVATSNKKEPKHDVDPTNRYLMAMPYDPHIHWNVTARNPIFEDEQDKRSHLGHRNTSSNSRSRFWEHPVRYLPDKSLKNLYRTIMVDFIPLEAKPYHLLDQIRGGALESARFYGPVTAATKFQTARLVFNYELGAQTVYRRGQNPGVFVLDQRVRVWQVLEPTYPRNSQLEDDIFEQGYTRVVIMHCNDPDKHRDVLKALPKMVATKSMLEILCPSGRGLYVIKFASVIDAINAMEELVNDERFRDCSFDYDDDECAEPYE